MTASSATGASLLEQLSASACAHMHSLRLHSHNRMDDDDLVPQLTLLHLLLIAVVCLVGEVWGAYFIDHVGRRNGWW
jgi:hypothetical protein